MILLVSRSNAGSVRWKDVRRSRGRRSSLASEYSPRLTDRGMGRGGRGLGTSLTNRGQGFDGKSPLCQEIQVITTNVYDEDYRQQKIGRTNCSHDVTKSLASAACCVWFLRLFSLSLSLSTWRFCQRSVFVVFDAKMKERDVNRFRPNRAFVSGESSSSDGVWKWLRRRLKRLATSYTHSFARKLAQSWSLCQMLPKNERQRC